MTSATWAMLLLVASGALGLLGLWQLLAGGSRSAELAARGRVGADEGGGRSVVRALDVRLRRTGPGKRLGAWLGGAGIKLLPIELVGLVAAASAVGFLIFSNLLAPFLALIVAVGGSVAVARAIIERRRGNRRDLFVGQLPEIARMLSNGTAAGLSMPQAVRMASRELADPAGAELRRVVEEMQVGRPVEDALEALRERLPSREVAVLMSTIAIQQRAGGDTVRALVGAGADARDAQGAAARDRHAAVGRRLHLLRRRRDGRRDDPADQRDLARRDAGDDVLADRHRRAGRRGDAVDGRLRADPPDDAGGGSDAGAASAAWPRLHRARPAGDPDAARPRAGGAARGRDRRPRGHAARSR